VNILFSKYTIFKIRNREDKIAFNSPLIHCESMEKFNEWADPFTGVQPFLPSRYEAGESSSPLPLRLLFGLSFLFLAPVFFLALGLLYISDLVFTVVCPDLIVGTPTSSQTGTSHVTPRHGQFISRTHPPILSQVLLPR